MDACNVRPENGHCMRHESTVQDVRPAYSMVANHYHATSCQHLRQFVAVKAKTNISYIYQTVTS
jgi:hypothetical protein